MANRWNIPPDLEKTIRERDRSCIYCGVIYSTPAASRAAAASWEHIINDASIITLENIALCCCACNSSKGQKSLRDWLNSAYCRRIGITASTIAPVARAALTGVDHSSDPQPLKRLSGRQVIDP